MKARGGTIRSQLPADDVIQRDSRSEYLIAEVRGGDMHLSRYTKRYASLPRKSNHPAAIPGNEKSSTRPSPRSVAILTGLVSLYAQQHDECGGVSPQIAARRYATSPVQYVNPKSLGAVRKEWQG